MCHGACLGLGLAAMGTANYDIYDLLKENLMTRDDAVIGEAAGLAMGLVMIGTKSEDALEDMLNVRTSTGCHTTEREGGGRGREGGGIPYILCLQFIHKLS